MAIRWKLPVALGLTGLVILGLWLLFGIGGGKRAIDTEPVASTIEPAAAPETSVAQRPVEVPRQAPLPVAQVPAATVSSTAQGSEASIMAKLHELGETSPLLSIQLARQADQRFPNSEDAPERGWIIVKSMVNLQQFDDAHAEAMTMVDKYRDTPWALDVERHLLVNPMTHPAERGSSTE